MEVKVVNQSFNEEQELCSLTIQSYEDLTVKLVHDGKKLSEVWKYYGLLFNGDSVVNPHRYYCSLCLKELIYNFNNGIKVHFANVHNVSISTATGNLKMHLFKGHNVSTFPEIEKDRYDFSCISKLESKKIQANYDEGNIEASGYNVTNHILINTPSNTNLNINPVNGVVCRKDRDEVLQSYKEIKFSVTQLIQNINSIAILNEIWYNPVVSNYYLKLSLAFIDQKWDLQKMFLCYAPLKSWSMEGLEQCFEIAVKKLSHQLQNNNRIYSISSIMIPHMHCMTNQEFCTVSMTQHLLTKDGLYSSSTFSNLISKCVTIVITLNNSHLYTEQILAENANYEFINELSDNYLIIKLDQQNPLICDLTKAGPSQVCGNSVKHIMRPNVILKLLKFVQNFSKIIIQSLHSVNEARYFLEEEEFKIINSVIKFLSQFGDLEEVFKSCSNTLIVVPVLKNKVKQFCAPSSDDHKIMVQIKLSIISHLDSYYQMSYLVKMACILDPSVKDIIDKDDAFQMLINRLRTIHNTDKHNSTMLVRKDDSIESNNYSSKKLKLFEVLKPQYHMTEYETTFIQEIRHYLQHIPTSDEVDMPLLFWKKHSHIYSNLALLAKEYLGIPAFSLPAESLTNVNSLKLPNELLHLNPLQFNVFALIKNQYQHI